MLDERGLEGGAPHYYGGAGSAYVTYCSAALPPWEEGAGARLSVEVGEVPSPMSLTYAEAPRSDGDELRSSGDAVAQRKRKKKKKEEKEDRPPSATNRNWNEEYQTLIARYRKAAGRKHQDPELMISVLGELATFTTSFLKQAKAIASYIVRELEVKNAKRRIPPIGDVGAGGEKYVYDGMFFKMARDHASGVSLYGGDEFAIKTASHEVKGMVGCITALLNAGLCFPMMAVINVCGWRLTVLPCLPISKHTLVYGSCDRGLTVYNSDPHMDRMMDSVGRQLNLKKHRCGLGPCTVPIVGPTDIEGHLVVTAEGKKRYYILDTARLFPPENPAFRKARGGVLYKLLRPELLIRNEESLSSDVFLQFGKHDRPREELRVVAATKRLYSQIVPDFAQSLIATQPVDRYPYDWHEYVRVAMHRQGINLRYLGSVRRLVPSAEVHIRKVLLTEMVVRTLRTMLDKAMRSKKKRKVGQLNVQTIASYYYANTSIGGDIDSRSEAEAETETQRTNSSTEDAATHKQREARFWRSAGKHGIKRELLRKYPEALTINEEGKRFDLREVIDMAELARRLPLDTLFQPQAKYLDLSLLEEGRAHLLRFLRYGESGEEQQQVPAKAVTLFSALEKLHRAYLVHPKTDYRTLTNLGYVYYRIASEWSRIKQRPGYAEMKQQLDSAKQESVRTMLCRKAMGYLGDAISIAYRGKQSTSRHDDDGDDGGESDTSTTTTSDCVKDQSTGKGRPPLLNRNLSIRCCAPTSDRSGYRSSLNLSMDECDELSTDGKNSDDTASSFDWNSDQEDKAKCNVPVHHENEKKAASKRVVVSPSMRRANRMSMDGGSTARWLGGDQQRTMPTAAAELVIPPANYSAYVGGIDGAPDVYTTTLPADGAVDVANTDARQTEVDEVVDKGIHEAWDALGDCHLLLAQRSASTPQSADHVAQAKRCLRAALRLLETGEGSRSEWAEEADYYRTRLCSLPS